MPVELPGRPMGGEDLEVKFRQWRAIVDKMHDTTRFTPNERLLRTGAGTCQKRRAAIC